MNPPRATMRLQLHRGFTFADSIQLVPYIAALGFSHVYASPLLVAHTGSIHGYDVVDPTRVNPELGGEDALRQLVKALRKAGLGLIVDIVPNHMAALAAENAWWRDVLTYGPNSRYASFFDIDWYPSDPALHGKILAPVLGRRYGDALTAGEIVLTSDDSGIPCIRYFDDLFPVRPVDHSEIASLGYDAFAPTDREGRKHLHQLLERQHYRLAWWQTAADEVNWRRFFEINGLAGVRVEDPEVFDATHATLLRLYEEGLIDGMRVDHIDGLANPPEYCRRLRKELDERAGRRPAHAPSCRPYLVVEKILGADERLPIDWGVDGTSGYDFMDAVTALLHDPAAEAPLAEFWASVSGRTPSFAEEEIAARYEVLERSFTAQLNGVADALHRIAILKPETRDITFAAIRRVIVSILTHFPVYRGYGLDVRTSEDNASFAKAMPGARRAIRAMDRPALGLVDLWLGGQVPSEAERPLRSIALTKFHQLSSALAAKAVEDTAFYRYGRLLSRNDVGFDAMRLAASPDEFHAHNFARYQQFPNALLATATHDHKRGEDVRARLAVLSEIPEQWAAGVRRWMDLNARYRGVDAPSYGDESMLYQMIVGAWPIELMPTDAVGLHDYTERLKAWQLKALREAKLQTDWAEPDIEYEEAAQSFLAAVMTDQGGALPQIAKAAQEIGPAGAVNGLTQTLLKLTVPGVPDFYQGSDFWDLSLVDPDNRLPVDFERRAGTLREDEQPTTLAKTWRDGRVKQALIKRALAFRKTRPDLFVCGDYQPIKVEGPRASHLTAFARVLRDVAVLIVVPRLVKQMLVDDDAITFQHAAWQRTKLCLPKMLTGRRLRNVFTGASQQSQGGTLSVQELLTDFPVALFAAD